MNSAKSIIKKLVPKPILNLVTGMFYGWKGNFSSWDEAKKRSTGYNSENILEKVKQASLKVRDGLAEYERDSVLFDVIQYSFPVLTALMWVAAKNNGKLNVLDFGGALGSSYYQNRRFLDSLNEVRWNIVEQPNFVNAGKELFEDENLRFYYSREECIKENNVDVVLLSSVLQYLEKPYELLDQLKNISIKYILIDRTPFIDDKDRITIQKVHSKIYKAKYPCWFFNEKKFMKYFLNDYELIFDFKALDEANIPSEFKGFLFRLKL